VAVISLLLTLFVGGLPADEPVRLKDDFTLEGHGGRVEVVTFSADGKLLASIQTWEEIFPDHGGKPTPMGMKVWDLAERKSLYDVPVAGARRAAFAPTGELVTVGPSSEKVPYNLREGRTDKIVRALPELTRNAEGEEFIAGLDEVACLPKGNAVVVQKNWVEVGKGREQRGGSTLEVFDFKTGERKWRELLGGFFCTAMALSPDGRYLAAGLFRRTFDAPYTKLLRETLGEEYNLSEGRPIVVYDLQTGKLAKVLPGHRVRVRSLSFGPEGKLLASGGGDSSVRVWDVASGKEKALWYEDPEGGEVRVPIIRDDFDRWAASLRGDGPQMVVAFAPDGKTVAASWPTSWLGGIHDERSKVSGGVFLLDVVGGKDKRPLPDRPGRRKRADLMKRDDVKKDISRDLLKHYLEKEIACALAYSPDGTHLALGYRGGHVRLVRAAALK
jgi:WD40 repeat protein